MTAEKGRGIGDDWRVDFSTLLGAEAEGMTRVVFYDPADPERCGSLEFFLDGLEVEDLCWKSLSDWTFQEVRKAEWEARQGCLRVKYELTKDAKRL